jgi:Peptidase of plants and bacteria
MRSLLFLVLILPAPSWASADGDAVGRARWEYDGGSIRRTLTWVERSAKTSHTFYETRRNPVFVELFDPSRQYTVRLYADKLLLRGGKGGAKKFPKFTRLYGGSWKDGNARLDWESPAGSLRAEKAEGDSKSRPAAWIERNFEGLHVFFELSRTDEFIELKDRQRDYTIRLSANELQIRGGNKSAGKHFDNFARLYRGQWALAEKPVSLTVILDTRQAPQVAPWAEGAKKLCEDWYPIIFDILSPVGRPPSRTIKIQFKDPIKTVAYTRAQEGEITISADWVKKHPDDIGMVIHELTHVVQNYPRSKNGTEIFWIGEGVADYVRYFEFEPEKRLRIDRKQTYRDGYKTAAIFLDWIQRTHNAHLVEKLNARLVIGEYSEDLFEDYTGASLGHLWAEFARWERR